MASLSRILIATSLAFVVGVPPAQASNPDLTVYRLRSFVYGQPATSLRDQDPVIFRAFARNLGPGTSDMYVTYSKTRNLYVKRETCSNNVSPDTPSCEWTAVPQGDHRIVRVKGYAVGQPGQYVRITFCSSNGQGTDDGDPSNDCRTTRLTIVS
jgi:hypothetical protein